MRTGLHVKYQFSCPILLKLKFYEQNFEKHSNIFHENPSSGNEIFYADVWTEGRTDVTKLIAAFRNFANASKCVEVVATLNVTAEKTTSS
jgi:hypothetical protein